jgi:type III secretion protein T
MNEFDWVELGRRFEDLFLLVALCSLRLFAAFNVLPATGTQFIQGFTRAGVVLIFGLFVAFGLPPEQVADLGAAQWLGLAFKECFIGLLLGFAASTVFWTAEFVGALIDTQAGYNNVQLTNPLSGQQSTPVSNLLLQMSIALFFVLGGMLVFLGALFESFKVWPLLSALPSLQGISDLVFLGQVDALMRTVVKFAAPALLVLVLVDLGFGLITRAADKLEPQGLSQPVKGAVTMLLLALMTGVFVSQVRQFLLPLDLIKRLQALLPT